MSGGSYNYLYSRDVRGAETIYEHIWDLREMKEHSIKIFNKEEFGKELEEFYTYLLEVETKICKKFEELKPLMKAFEWWISADSCEKDFDKKFKEWKENKKEKGK